MLVVGRFLNCGPKSLRVILGEGLVRFGKARLLLEWIIGIVGKIQGIRLRLYCDLLFYIGFNLHYYSLVGGITTSHHYVFLRIIAELL